MYSLGIDCTHNKTPLIYLGYDYEGSLVYQGYGYVLH
jgi:hypothetical protein